MVLRIPTSPPQTERYLESIGSSTFAGLTLGDQQTYTDRLRYVATRHGTGSLGHRVSGSFGSSYTSGSPGHRVIILTRCETRVFRFSKKAQDKDIKIYIFVKIRPTVIEILTFNK